MTKNSWRKLKQCYRAVMLVLFPFILRDYAKFKSLSHSRPNRFELGVTHSFPCLFDKTFQTRFDRHYIYHTAWAARIVRQIAPDVHVDISSSLYFSSIVSAFVPVQFYDYRPPALTLSNCTVKRADLLELPFASRSIHSLSCMHTVEHVGLGRYGDTIDPDADLKAAKELERVVAEGGHLLFVVPIGKAILRFNAMRIYSYRQVVEMFAGLHLQEFSLIHEYEEDGGITVNATESMADREDYGCGCFWFLRP